MNEDTRTLLLKLGQAQIDAMFARQDEGPVIDDSEFLPLIEVVLTAFEKTDCGATIVDELWRHAYAAYDGRCREDDLESTADDNRELMQSYFLGKNRFN